MPPDLEPVTPERWEGFSRQCMFSGLRGVAVGDEAVASLGSGFSLVSPSAYILSARDHSSMTGTEFADGASASRYLVYKHEPPVPGKTYEEIKAIFWCGMLALQVLKPVPTLGLVFYGDYMPSGGFALQMIERRPPMEAGPWALKRPFDRDLLKAVPSIITGIQTIMEGANAEKKNAFILLQLGLEHFHPLIAGLLWVTGLEAIFDSFGKEDFKRHLCAYLGESTLVFPDWHVPGCSLTVGEIAFHLYVLRNKLAHGGDLRKAASDKKFPVDLIGKRTLPDSPEQVPYALLLSEAACYLLCQVLQKEVARVCPC